MKTITEVGCVYYNEFDKKKCGALKQLMADGHISKGDIDDRSIHEVRGSDLEGYTRCHFFAGIGLWDYALDLAGWGEDNPVWTGSCPCQPFSAAGRQKGKDDDRHLWPEWLRLIEECKPPVIFGEQVNAAITQGWLDDVYQGLEAQDYAVGAVVLPASAVGAPHRRERLWFVADSGRESARGEEFGFSGERQHSEAEGLWAEARNGFTDDSTVGDSEHDGQSTSEVRRSCEKTIQHDTEGQNIPSEPTGAGTSRELPEESMGDSNCQRLQGLRRLEQEHDAEGWEGTQRHPWQTGVFIDCPDGKQRLVEPRIPLLANGYPERVGLIHCAGDAIVPQVAAEFITAFMGKENEK